MLCGWRRVHMHKHYNTIYALILPMFYDIDCLCNLCYLSNMYWKLVVCLLFALTVFTFFFLSLIYIYIYICVKNPKTHKKYPKSLIGIIVYCHKHVLPCTFVLMALCIYEHSLFFMHSYHCGKNLDIYVTVVNRSSNLS